jgi:N-acetylmuramoyl-L-alanine amidase
MPGNDLNRRSLLALLAGAGVVGAVDPRGAVAGLLRADSEEPRLFTINLGSVGAGVRTVNAPRLFDLLGVRWTSPASPCIEVRTLLRNGGWGGWARLGATAHRPSGGEATDAADNRLGGEPVWVRSSETLQLRLSEQVSGLSLHLVDAGDAEASPRRAASVATALPLASPVLDAGPGQPPIIARRAWAGGGCPPRVAPEYGDVELCFVHHTLNPNGYSAAEVPAMLRAIYLFHRDVNGWNDIGYNFAIDLFGRIFEARAGGIDEPVVGAQAGGYNAVSTGVAVLGDFEATPISSAAKRALQELIAWKLSLHGVPVEGEVTVRVDPAGAVYSRFPANAKVSLPRVAGHRDADATECPGNALYGELPSIRRASARLAGDPASLSIRIGEAPPPATSGGEPSTGAAGAGAPPSQPAPEGAQQRLLSGRLTLLDGSPIPNAVVEIQARGVSRRGEVVQERTLTTATTDTEGNWSLPVAISHPQQLHPQYRGYGKKRRRLPEPLSALRVLFPGGNGLPATISSPLEVQGLLTVGA